MSASHPLTPFPHYQCTMLPAVLGRGYNHSVDWWTLGVLMYVLLTARQPFSSPKTHDPMEVRMMVAGAIARTACVADCSICRLGAAVSYNR